MQNEDDFYVIDMALASESTLSDVVEPAKFKKYTEDWIPDLRAQKKMK